MLDADEDEQFEQLKQLAEELEAQDVPSYLETSRRGGHLRLFFSQPISGQKARRLGQQLLSTHNLQMEIFPKQEMIGDGPGSLIRVPFGVHQVKKSISVYEFVSQFVDLKRSGSGYVGHCPFHDDQRPSFSVNAQKNYWHCFAGCGGGSIIDFWMIREGIDFSTALMELEEILLHHSA